VVVDAQAAAGIDGFDMDAVAASSRTSLATRSMAAPKGSAERICEPICTLTPCA
jgi:hypothetical protein